MEEGRLAYHGDEILKMQYPGIAAACFLIAIDNGGINRTRSADKQATDFGKWLAMQDYPNIDEIDQFLSALSKEDLELLSVGGTGEPEVEAIRAKAPAFTDDLLNAYFDEVC